MPSVHARREFEQLRYMSNALLAPRPAALLPRGSARADVDVDGARVQKIFEPGQHIKATLGEFLEWMEVDLDKPANEAPNEQWLSGQDRILQGAQGVADGKYPYLRISGMFRSTP